MQLLDRLKLNHCDVVLGLFPSGRPHKIDMVDIDPEGTVKNIVIKPQQTDLSYTWGVAVWTPAFTRFMHNYVKSHESSAENEKELFLGEVIMAAITEGLRVEAVHVSDEAFLDIGTPEDLLRTAKLLLARVE